MSMYRLKGSIQHYAWGGHHFIADLLGEAVPSKAPCAEYWLGAHRQAPSRILPDAFTEEPLDAFIARDPVHCLGPETARKFGRLPYLLKVLDVKDMLSIQVHPSKEEALLGFARENAAGIPLDAPNRNFKDDNHKPEVMVALSEFWLLHGFLSEDRLLEVLEAQAAWTGLVQAFRLHGYQGLYRQVMELPQSEIQVLLGPLMLQVLPLYDAGALAKSDPAFWAARAIRSGICSLERLDRGIFSIYFFNILRLHPGEGIFQAAGVPHAYLEGQNVELMANSDNVLRGGLSPKHVDVAELLRHIRFEAIAPSVLSGIVRGACRDYPCPVEDFGLSSYTLHPGSPQRQSAASAEILLVLDGQGQIRSRSRGLDISRGEALWVEAGEAYELQTNSNCMIFRAFVPVD